MNIHERTSGSAYAGDPDYDRMTGYVTRTYQTEWRDTQGNLWRKTCTVINLGRADRVTPQTGDELLESEKMPGDMRTIASEKVRQINLAKGMERRERSRDSIIAVLRERGPLTSTEIADALDCVRSTMETVLNAYKGVIFNRAGGVRAPTGGKAATLWGLVGVHQEVKLKKEETTCK